MQKELKSRQVCLFFIALVPIVKLFTMPSISASFANEDMWISALFSVILDTLTIIILFSVCKRENKGFFELLSQTFGKGFSIFILCLYFIYFTLKAIIPLGEQKDYVELTLYTLMPTKFYFMPFFLFAFYICTKKLRVLGRASDILWLFTLIGILILFSLSITNADFSAILPIGARGVFSVVNGSYHTATWFGDGVYFMFLTGEFVYGKKDGIKIFFSYLVGAIAVVIFAIIFYSVFTFIAPRQRFALTEISKYSTVINNIGRFDYIGIFMLLFSNMFGLSLPLFFSARILNHIFKFKKTYLAPLITVGIQVLIMLFFEQYFFSIENFILNYSSAFFILLSNVFPAVFCLAVKFKGKKEIANANS